MARIRATVFLLLCSSCGGPFTLNAPNVSPALAREPTRIDLEPIETRAPVEGSYAPPGPAAVLTTAIRQDLEGRGLTGGEPGGYVVRCSLERFVVRSETRLTEGTELMALYADLSCEARRTQDAVAVWRGELRGRACEEGGNVLGTSTGVKQRLLDRALSDATREMASDLALRGLGLHAVPSTRVFADESQQRATSGIDDTPWGPAALQQNVTVVERALHTLDARDTTLRAGAWNVVAMTAGPGEPWSAGDQLALDSEPLVRFVQYKALGRHAGDAALTQLRGAVAREGDQVLLELLQDVIATGGIGLARSKR